MTVRRLLTILCCTVLWAGTLPAALKTIEDGLELRLSTVTLPTRSPAPLRFRQCPTCTPEALQITAATGWYLAGTGNALAEISHAALVETARNSRPDSFMYVYYQRDTGLVTRIVLDAIAGNDGDNP